MNADRELTRVLRRWLRQDRGEDADRIIDSVLDQIDWIEQRRPGRLARRFSIMHSNRFRFGIAAAAVAAVAFLGIRFLPPNVGGPGPEEFPDNAFISERHQYALLFPDDSWQIFERPGEWAPGTVFSDVSAGIDVVPRAGMDEPYVLLASQPMDLDRDAWLARYDRLAAETFEHCQLESTETRTIDGEEARIASYGCDGAGDGVEALMFHGDRVYGVRVFHDDESYDPRPVLDEFLDIFRFLD